METGNSENKGYYSDPAKKDPLIPNGNNNNRILGIVVVVIGMLMLVRATDIIHYPLLEKILSFPVFLIILALLIGYKNKFDVGGWVFLLGAGVYFLLRKFDYNAGRYAFPLVLITVGLFVLAKNRQKLNRADNRDNNTDPGLPGPHFYPENPHNVHNEYTGAAYQPGYDPQGEYVKIDSIFSGNERVVLSSNFKGGKVGTIFGGVVLDCKAAQIQQDIVIDVYSVFGSVELIFPANWRVINETTTIFGTVEDKRRLVNSTGIERRVIITGFTLFGGVEIKNL
ncbi:MAG: hypothetical protein BGO31_06925 [Bacteroidetes bacterium 43-16]|nr:MAG: hypothetical protein BGO31_06925 [Bacteroidetes bacterium 43-16]